MNRNRLLEVLPGFGGKRVLVVGDLFLDEYLVGRPTRISREAPVLILEFEKRYALPGGGTNPARNVRSLGAEALMVGIVGNDEAGFELRGLLQSVGVGTEGVVVDDSRPTITKTRILAHGNHIIRQQIVRVDRLSRNPVDGAAIQRLIEYLEKTVPHVDAVLLSDYKSGVVTPAVIEASRRLATQHGKLLTVDSQGDLHRFRGFGLVKANQGEVEATLGETLDSEEAFAGACRRLLEELGAGVVLITRGADGMSVMHTGGRHTHIEVANRSEVFDVTGAGDTAVAVATLALAAGARPVIAAHLANYAAGLVVRKIGNATTTVEEMREAITSSQFPRVDPEPEFLQ
ncbi:MAG: bifunctional heptose 7-phosphate kinase/heptose 1-phosphate adenyltransferase [Sphingomonadaceae bacterium]